MYMNHTHSTDKSHDLTTYVKLTFKGNRRETFINPSSLPLMPGDYALVESENGIDMGIIATKSCNVKACTKGVCGLKHIPVDQADNDDGFRPIMRKGTNEEIQQLFENRRLEDTVFMDALKLIKQNRLSMKLVDVEYQFDQKKVTFFYVADERVDFRQLVKDLAYTFKTRIEMRQIGVHEG